MNQKNNQSMETLLQDTAEKITPNPNFAAQLEEKLMEAHQPRKGFALPLASSLLQAAGWGLGILALILITNWVIAARPHQMIGSSDTFVCPVTQPNGSQPPGESAISSNYLGNDKLWTGLWPDGKVYMQADNHQSNGSFDMKWPWWRAEPGAQITIEGHRLDADTDPLSADIPEGYSSYFQVSGLIFPTTGCWEITAHSGDASLTFVTEVVFGETTPTPETQQNNTPPTEVVGGYDFRGAKLILATPLPELPVQANVYTLLNPKPANAEYALKLARQFGIEGEIYKTHGQFPDTTALLVTDGKQQLIVYEQNYYSYSADIVKSSHNYNGFKNDQTEAIIHNFLANHQVDYQFRRDLSELMGGYVMNLISVDGYPMRYEYFSQPIMRVTLDENGNVLTVDAAIIDYDRNPIGEYDLISPQEAFNILLDDSIPGGKIESVHSASVSPGPQQWIRDYPNDQKVTIYGYVSHSDAVNANLPPFIAIDGVPAVGNTSGMESLDNDPRSPTPFIEAQGHYFIENGIRKFKVDSWDSNLVAMSWSGHLEENQGQAVLVTDENTGNQPYPIDALPSDAPFNTDPTKSWLSISGVLVDGKIEWTSIQYIADSPAAGGGGGGGGGLGFYQLNLSGTPIPIPDATQTPDPSSMLPPRLDAVRGVVTVFIYTNTDGSQRTEYYFSAQGLYYKMEGNGLEALNTEANRPIDVWGTVSAGENGTPVVTVEKFDIVYPGIQFQILKGTETASTIDSQDLAFFTAEDGTTYVELANNCSDPLTSGVMGGTKNIPGKAPDSILLEVLALPDKTMAGFPVICIFNSSPATDMQSGNPLELSITADKPTIIPENTYTQPNLTIDHVELIYYTSNPEYQKNNPSGSAAQPFIQPVWDFHGHYDNGDEVDFMIQALKKDFLSPELATFLQGG